MGYEASHADTPVNRALKSSRTTSQIDVHGALSAEVMTRRVLNAPYWDVFVDTPPNRWNVTSCVLISTYACEPDAGSRGRLSAKDRG